MAVWSFYRQRTSGINDVTYVDLTIGAFLSFFLSDSLLDANRPLLTKLYDQISGGSSPSIIQHLTNLFKRYPQTLKMKKYHVWLRNCLDGILHWIGQSKTPLTMSTSLGYARSRLIPRRQAMSMHSYRWTSMFCVLWLLLKKPTRSESVWPHTYYPSSTPWIGMVLRIGSILLSSFFSSSHVSVQAFAS